jgi:hypothetical protein
MESANVGKEIKTRKWELKRRSSFVGSFVASLVDKASDKACDKEKEESRQQR